MIKVTYVPPNEPGYPASTVWNGITFLANVPVTLDPANKNHGYLVPVIETWIDPATQQKRTKAVDKWVSMIEIARTNPHFQVEGEVLGARRGPGRPRIPKTADEYRNHAVAWITETEDHDALAERWNEEEALRARCGVGDEDVDYLRPIFDARHHELKKQAA
jgi:hypothetical protein